MAKKIIYLLVFLCLSIYASAKDHKTMAVFSADSAAFPLYSGKTATPILLHANTDKGVARATADLQKDVERVSGQQPVLRHTLPGSGRIVIIGIQGQDPFIDRLVEAGKIDGRILRGRREQYLIQTVTQPFEGIQEALVIAGSDKRGAIYGIYEVCEQIGVSPWYYWADVPPQQHSYIGINPGSYTAGEPKVRYRGIFLNDEAPALTGWVRANFGGYNSKFYRRVFELLLRLRANFLWPAMWDAAFYDDDPLNTVLAQEYGIIIGTSHHEPMARAHKEWQRYGQGPWNYNKNSTALDAFWQKGIERIKGAEDLVTIGMRGDGDEPMSTEADIALLEKIVARQRKIIRNVTGHAAEQTPQVWALYKEVQDYYDRGMRVPDDVTLLLCDDNWGNIRKLPAPDARKRSGGYGMYYHFDYVGGPRSYKWINLTPISKIWEQMNLCYEYGVDRIWIVNVGDLKPMEYPITFFLNMAWDPAQFRPDNLHTHTINFFRRQFGQKHATAMAQLLAAYTRYNRRVSPELLHENTYSLNNYNEFEKVVNDYRTLSYEALQLYHLLPAAQHDAYNQLLLYPIQAMANLYELYYSVALNHRLYRENDPGCNYWAEKAEDCFARDSILSDHYNHIISGGKWNHMMDQPHIGYTYWQQPEKNVIPKVFRIKERPEQAGRRLFKAAGGYVAIEAEHYAAAIGGPGVQWTVIPGFGRTLSGITLLPAKIQLNDKTPVYVEYAIEAPACDSARLTLVFAPSLNFNSNKGLRYAVSVDGGREQTVNINGHYTVKEMEQWQAQSANYSTTIHRIIHPGKHTIRLRFLDTGLVLEKLWMNFGGLLPSYLGPPESEFYIEPKQHDPQSKN